MQFNMRGWTTDRKVWQRGVRALAVFVLLGVVQLALSSSAHAATAPVGASLPTFGAWVAYRFTYPGQGARLAVTLTFSPVDASSRLDKAVVLQAYSPDNPPPKGRPIGAAHTVAPGVKTWELTSGMAGDYIVVIHNWDPQRRPLTVQLTTTNLADKSAGPALSYVSSSAAVRKGLVTNGIVVDGIVVDGIIVDGIVVDGIVVD